jgi:hypothetical protein
MAKMHEVSPLLTWFNGMITNRIDSLSEYGIAIKPDITLIQVRYFLELQDYRCIARFIEEDRSKPIFLHLKSTNPLFLEIEDWHDLKKMSELIDMEMRKVFEPGIYTYLEE